ncbi:cation-translocating P-type ATPase [Lacticaseibacillus zhaodongensis]|uniref:cation-translocating P-type ATPase n=1 Tax=Lacticaseibacillus zhaodongensis TaxID=2668065 RepID=UPI0012D2B790|nr:cation-translocating P-type ATPase [Lacticaseibacillus zhaodongensis]
MATNPKTGLSKQEVHQQIAAGKQNNEQQELTRSVKSIVAGNTLTLFNLVNLVIAALIITTGSYNNLLFLGVAIVNTAIGTFQEIRAKHQVDSMTILNQEKVHVRRDGQEQEIAQSELVVGDILLLHRGSQVPVDGVATSATPMEIDESPLTGEPNAIAKSSGDKLYSGSFVVAGSGSMEVRKVGSETFASKLALEAKAEKASGSQLLATINRIIRVLTFVLIPLGIALFTVSMIRRGDYNRAILTTSGAVIGMIPEGLVLLTNVALAVGSRNLASKHVLVRSMTAIEALARVDTICLDKTGTITSGKLKIDQFYPQPGVTAAQLQTAASAVVYALSDDNETALAIKERCPQPDALEPLTTVPFSSARKWSGASFADGNNYFIGAPEFTFGDNLDPACQKLIKEQSTKGLRVLVVGRAQALQPALTKPELMGIITIADELRPTAIDTFDFFAKQDVRLKVISGDNPVTVAHVAKRAHIAGADNYVNMSEVPDDADYGALMQNNTVFGRVTPQQKKHLIAAYQELGHTVAMTGDGVNDVLALRQADCSIAMASGSEAASAIADFVLLESNFDAMTGVLNEGRRVINNVESVASLYLIKTMYSCALAAIFIFINADYPIIPINLTPVSAMAVAVPSFFLTLEPNFARVTGQFMRKVMTYAAPAALAVVIYTLFMTWLAWILRMSFAETGTIVALLIACVSYNVLFRVSRPFNRYKAAMLVVVGVMLVTVFFGINKLFSLQSLWNFKLFLIYAPLAVSTVPFYLLLQEFLGRRVLGRINWR